MISRIFRLSEALFFFADANGEIIGEAKEITEMSLYDLFDVKENGKLYYVYEGKDGKLETFEVGI